MVTAQFVHWFNTVYTLVTAQFVHWFNTVYTLVTQHSLYTSLKQCVHWLQHSWYTGSTQFIHYYIMWQQNRQQPKIDQRKVFKQVAFFTKNSYFLPKLMRVGGILAGWGYFYSLILTECQCGRILAGCDGESGREKEENVVWTRDVCKPPLQSILINP